MATEVELDPRHRILPFKIRAASKEAQPHKAAHVLDPDPKSHWSTSTNAKEWLLLELEDPCLLQQIRIHNKSVLEWEISLGLRYKPDLFSKVRTRCEAPRRESQYMTNYAPCRYVRLSCLRGNPIAIYSVQLIGISMPGLEPEYQPLVDHLLPHVISTKHELQDLYLQLLGEIMIRLSPFSTYLENDLASYSENMESTLRFLALLSGPFYPILIAIDEREKLKNLATANDTESSKGASVSLFTISSNFQAPPRRSRSPAPSQQSAGQLVAFRPEVTLLLLRAAFQDHALGTVCRMVARIFHKISSRVFTAEVIGAHSAASPGSGLVGLGYENLQSNAEFSTYNFQQTDYSTIFGEDFVLLENDVGESGLSALLDLASIEEGLLHFLYASISKPLLCRRLAEMKPDLVPVLPYIQAVLPAIRPASVGILDQLDESFSPWQAPLVQRVFSQVVSLVTTVSYRPLLDACAGYLSSFSLAHEKAACILIDLCSGPLAPWLPVVIAKVDLAFELVEGIMGSFQVIGKGVGFAGAALVYVILGLSGHIDESLTFYKAVKHNIIFVIEILEPLLLPAITPIKNTIAFGDVSAVLTEKQERDCSLALDILRAATKKPAILSALEIEWRKGNVKPSVLITVMAPHLPVPAGVDVCRGVSESGDENTPLLQIQGITDSCSKKLFCDHITKSVVTDDEVSSKPDFLPADNHGDPYDLFAPIELKLMNLKLFSSPPQDAEDFGQFGKIEEPKRTGCDYKEVEFLNMDTEDFKMLHSDHRQLCNYQERELRAAEFICFAERLHSQGGTFANHEAAVDCLLLGAEFLLNPLMSYSWQQEHFDMPMPTGTKKPGSWKETPEELGWSGLLNQEEERDKMVFQVLLKAAEWDAQARDKAYQDVPQFEVSTRDEKEFIENSAIDAITLLRKHQALFFRFLIVQLKREADYICEALLQGLLFLLSAATDLLCSAEHVVNIILRIAEHVNLSVLHKHNQQEPNHGTMPSMLSIRRRWSLLCRLVAAASGGESGDDDDEFILVDAVYHKELVPPSAWMTKLGYFASSSLPLVRFVGWKGLARFARSQHENGFVLASDLQQLSALLSVFADDLMCADISESRSLERHSKGSSINFLEQYRSGPKNCLYPEIDCLCPSLQRQFISSALVILDAVCLQLKGVPATALPDILSWFSELCSHPFTLEGRSDVKLHTKIKGFAADNVRFIILRLLEVLLLEHMEAMVPELPRVVSVVLSLCQSCYCDISLLDSVLKALKPIVSYGITTADSADLQLEDGCGTVTTETLCFDPLIQLLHRVPESRNNTLEQNYNGSLLLFLSGAVLSVLSFTKKLQVMHLLRNWANFTAFSETTSYSNYLCAFQKVFEACQLLLEKKLGQQGLPLPYTTAPSQMLVVDNAKLAAARAVQTGVDTTSCLNLQEVEELQADDLAHQVTEIRIDENHSLPTENGGSSATLSIPKVQEFEECIETLAFTIVESLERVWNLHPQLAENLTKTLAQCLMASSSLVNHSSRLSSLLSDEAQESGEGRQLMKEERQQELGFFAAALDKVCQAILTFQKSHYWQVAVCGMEFLLSQPYSRAIVEIMPLICCILQYQCTYAPRVSWRELSVKWLSNVVEILIAYRLSAPITPLAELFKVLMEHKEPEQRAGALQELENLADLEGLGRLSMEVATSSNVFVSQQTPSLHKGKLVNAGFVAEIVDAGWDGVCSLAACDPSLRIRKKAIEVLIKFVPFAQSDHLQRLLSSVDTFLPGLAKESYTMIDAPVTRLSLALLSRACLYCGTKEISMVPSRVWCSLEVLSKSRHGSVLGEAERATCIALLQLRDHEQDAKQLIQASLARKSGGLLKKSSQFSSVQGTVLQVLARLNVARMIEKRLCSKITEDDKELEEAEMELELIRKKRALEENHKHQEFQHQTPLETHFLHSAESKSKFEKLQQLREQILSEELAATREEISARLERQRIARQNRQLALEQSTLREIELLQELDREKAAEVERDIERQKVLERERARTKELRYSLDLEAERRTQRDLQRELEQRESGTTRPSRREFPGSGSSSRPRERYRERDGGRPSQDPRSSSGVVRENSTTPPATPTAGSRSTGR